MPIVQKTKADQQICYDEGIRDHSLTLGADYKGGLPPFPSVEHEAQPGSREKQEEMAKEVFLTSGFGKSLCIFTAGLRIVNLNKFDSSSAYC